MDKAARYRPVMSTMRPATLFERLLDAGQTLPGKPGMICYRKLKRRYRRRNEGTYPRLLEDLRPGDLCIDLGANVGDITTAFLDRGAEVIAFEPDPDTFVLLERRVAGRNGVTLIPKAAGGYADVLTLRRHRQIGEDQVRFSQAASLVRVDRKMEKGAGVEVEVVDFVAYLEALDRDVRILKIDIEGSEFELLDRLLVSPALSRIDAIFVEVHEWMNSAAYIPKALSYRATAERIGRPYINLYWW